jgi:hypothetical protein
MHTSLYVFIVKITFITIGESIYRELTVLLQYKSIFFFTLFRVPRASVISASTHHILVEIKRAKVFNEFLLPCMVICHNYSQLSHIFGFLSELSN